ncbi:MAG: putative sulfate exporter family transporter [Bacteroidota bacterium]
MKIETSTTSQQVVFFIAIILCCTPFIDPPIALLMGFVLAQTIGNPFVHLNRKVTGWLLKISVICLGFGINLYHAIDAGKEGLLFTVVTIAVTLFFGWLFGRLLKIDGKISFLISSGTAICGGSAIAAVSSIVKSDEKQTSVALGTIFILNSIALLIFPSLGHWLNMTQHEFGLWCAIAIHDTSSVVGAAAKYGQEALQVATTVKLERALWIIPLCLVTMFFVKGESKKVSIPYFIFFFIAAMCLSTYFQQFKPLYSLIEATAKKGLTVTLFLIGSGLSISAIKTVGAKPLIQGVLLWLLISIFSVLTILLVK